MPKHHPLRFIAYFVVLPIFFGSFLGAIFNYLVIPSLANSDFDYYNVLYIVFVSLLVVGGLCVIFAFLNLSRKLRQRLKGVLGFFFFLFLSIICFFALVVLLVSPTKLFLGKEFPSKSKYPVKQSKPVIITNVNVVDIDDRSVQRDVRVLIDGGRIKQVGSAQEVPLLSDAEIINGAGRTLLPGLIDAHVHLGLSGKMENWYRSFFVECLEKSMERNARFTVESGVTTVREMPDYYDSSFELKRAIEEGRVVGPKMVVSGPAIAQFGGYFGWPAFGYLCKNPADVRNAININLNKGAGFIIVPTINSTFLRAGERDMNKELLDAAIEYAHSQEVPVTAHTMWSDGALDAAEAGVDGLEHMPSVMDSVKKSLVEKILREGIFVVPTLFAYSNLNEIAANPELIKAPEYRKRFGPSYKIAQEYAQQYNNHSTSDDQELRLFSEILDKAVSKYLKSNFVKFVDAGTTIGVGTDAGDLLMPHGWISKELEKYVEFGMSPMDAIVAATYTNALILDKEDEIGRVKTGFKADLAIVNGDPTVNITDIEKVDMVFKDGVLVYKKK